MLPRSRTQPIGRNILGRATNTSTLSVNRRRTPIRCLSAAQAPLQHHQQCSIQPDRTNVYTPAYHPDNPEPDYDALGETSELNLFTAVNSAMATALRTDPTAIVFGEDVAFGGVFRCTQDLRDEFGSTRVFNTPLSENGIAGMAVGYASMGGTAIGEIQFGELRRRTEFLDRTSSLTTSRHLLKTYIFCCFC